MRTTISPMATSVPTVNAPEITRCAPTQYSIAAPTAPTRLRPMKNARPYSALRTPMSRTVRAVRLNPARSTSWRPNSLTSSAPATFRRSVITVFMVALCSMPWRVSAWRRRPTRLVGAMNTGSSASASSVRRHSSASMATSVVASTIVLDTTELSVPVNARWAPMTSLFMRLISDPVCTWVKKATGIRCTWSYRLTRRSKIRPSPMRADHQRSTNDSPASQNAAATMIAASTLSCDRSPAGMASSMTRPNRIGGTRNARAPSSCAVRNPDSIARYGRASAAARRTVPGAMWCPSTPAGS